MENPAFVMDDADPRHQIRPAGGKGERHGRQRPRGQHVVGIEPGHDLAARPGEALVDGLALALVLLARRESQAVLIARQNIRRLVGRAAIHDDMLDRRIILMQDGEDRLLDEAALIQRGRDDADPRPGPSIGHRRREGQGRRPLIGPLIAAGCTVNVEVMPRSWPASPDRGAGRACASARPEARAAGARAPH